MSSRSVYSYEDFEADTDSLYNHLLQLVRQIESSSQLIDRYRSLFVQGVAYPQPEIQKLVYRLVNSRWAERYFNSILNRCCYILINHWSYHSEGETAIADLVALFHETPRYNDTLPVQRLQDLVQQFGYSKQHDELSGRIWAARDLHRTKQHSKARPLRELISRFPPLYPHYLLEEDSSESGRETVKQQQQKREQEIEENLRHYGIRKFSAHQRRSTAVIENPMLLDTGEVDRALRHFSYEGVEAVPYHEAARQLVRRSQQLPSHRAFKDLLHRELSSFVAQAFRLHNPTSRHDYAKHDFDHWLYKQLQDALPQHNNQLPSESFRVQTCTYLLDVLLEPPSNRLDHHVKLMDLTANLGTMLTVGLLLKIVLVCHNGNSTLIFDTARDPNLDAIRSHLAERFAALFRQYEKSNREGVNWLVECLEHWMIVASIHFGKYGISYWSKMLQSSS